MSWTRAIRTAVKLQLLVLVLATVLITISIAYAGELYKAACKEARVLPCGCAYPHSLNITISKYVVYVNEHLIRVEHNVPLSEILKPCSSHRLPVAKRGEVVYNKLFEYRYKGHYRSAYLVLSNYGILFLTISQNLHTIREGPRTLFVIDLAVQSLGYYRGVFSTVSSSSKVLLYTSNESKTVFAILVSKNSQSKIANLTIVIAYPGKKSGKTNITVIEFLGTNGYSYRYDYLAKSLRLILSGIDIPEIEKQELMHLLRIVNVSELRHIRIVILDFDIECFLDCLKVFLEWQYWGSAASTNVMANSK